MDAIRSRVKDVFNQFLLMTQQIIEVKLEAINIEFNSKPLKPSIFSVNFPHNKFYLESIPFYVFYKI